MSTNKYHNGLIYKIICKDTTITDIYVGSTCDFQKRKRDHKSRTNNKKWYVYKFIRENGGWDNWEMLEITKHPCESRLELETEERRYMDLLKSTLNIHIPTRTRKEWRQDNREQICINKKEYSYNNKEKLLQKFNCECGGKYTKTNKSCHSKTKKHKSYLATIKTKNCTTD